MSKRRRIFAVLALVLLTVAVAAWFRFAPGDAPPGQPPLVTLNAGSLETLRTDFNRDVGRARLIVLLSPT